MACCAGKSAVLWRVSNWIQTASLIRILIKLAVWIQLDTLHSTALLPAQQAIGKSLNPEPVPVVCDLFVSLLSDFSQILL